MLTIADLFKLQSTFNKRVGLDDEKFADVFSKECSAKHRIEAGQWIDDMLKAISSEIEELRNCCYWKHWCEEAQRERYKLKDVGAARKEVIDLLHFWISLTQILGISPEMVSGMYASKLAKNIKRQEDGYSIEAKDLAWEIFKEDPIKVMEPGDDTWRIARSLEELSESAQAYCLALARERLADKNVEGE